jgi:hypothetical protein
MLVATRNGLLTGQATSLRGGLDVGAAQFNPLVR